MIVESIYGKSEKHMLISSWKVSCLLAIFLELLNSLPAHRLKVPCATISESIHTVFTQLDAALQKMPPQQQRSTEINATL